MAASTTPIFSRLADIQWANEAKTANTDKQADAGTVYTIFTADGTNGGFVDKLVIQAAGSNIATLLRFFINNGGATSTAANNVMIREVSLAAVTSSETAAIPAVEVLLGFALPAGYTIIMTVATGIAAGVNVTAIGGKY